MPKFVIQVGRDARIYFKATVEAESLEDAMSNVSRHGYDCPPSVIWEDDGIDEFDNLETCAISANDGEETLLASYDDGEGWKTNERD